MKSSLQPAAQHKRVIVHAALVHWYVTVTQCHTLTGQL
jgi:hypothetical protein